MPLKNSVQILNYTLAMPKILYLVIFLLLAYLPLVKTTFALPEFGFKRTICEDLADKYSKQYNIPDGLVASISRVESGRADQTGNIKAWPWALNLAGDSKFFDTKAQTLEFLTKALAEGKTNIDIGCMQINYRWHKDEFSSIEKMLDPDQNVRYAIKFLQKLFDRHQNWEDAVKHYHSATKSLHTKYYRKVARVFNQIRDESREPSISFISSLPPMETVYYDYQEMNDFKSGGMFVFASDDFTPRDDMTTIQVNKESSKYTNGSKKMFNFSKVSASFDTEEYQPKEHLPDYIKRNWKLVLAMRSILGND